MVTRKWTTQIPYSATSAVLLLAMQIALYSSHFPTKTDEAGKRLFRGYFFAIVSRAVCALQIVTQ